MPSRPAGQPICHTLAEKFLASVLAVSGILGTSRTWVSRAKECFHSSIYLTRRHKSPAQENITTILPAQRRSHLTLHSTLLQACEFKLTTSGNVVLLMPLSSLSRLFQITMTLRLNTCFICCRYHDLLSSRPGYLLPTKCTICSKDHSSKRSFRAMIKSCRFSLQTKTPFSNAPHPRNDPSSLTKHP